MGGRGTERGGEGGGGGRTVRRRRGCVWACTTTTVGVRACRGGGEGECMGTMGAYMVVQNASSDKGKRETAARERVERPRWRACPSSPAAPRNLAAPPLVGVWPLPRPPPCRECGGAVARTHTRGQRWRGWLAKRNRDHTDAHTHRRHTDRQGVVREATGHCWWAWQKRPRGRAHDVSAEARARVRGDARGTLRRSLAPQGGAGVSREGRGPGWQPSPVRPSLVL